MLLQQELMMSWNGHNSACTGQLEADLIFVGDAKSALRWSRLYNFGQLIDEICVCSKDPFNS